MTLQQMKYALTIAEQGSMNKAAEQLFISQPSLTSAVRELEKEIGIQVFVRSSRGVSVTAEGADFLMYVRQVYQQYELLHQKYGGSGGAKRKFGVSTQHYSFAVKAFVEMVKNFGTLNFEFAIRETRTMDVLHDVGGFRSEVGIIYQCDYNRRIIGKMLHELELAERISDTVVCVAGDRIDRIGPPEEIFTRAYIAKLYRMEHGKYDPCFDSLEFVP